MRFLHCTLESPGQDLALDASLFRALDDTGRGEVLRVWETASPAVVVGHSGRIEEAVDQAACAAEGVPVARRLTGGGAVVIGPGCLNFSLVLSLERRPMLRDVAWSYRVVLGALATVLATPGLAQQGLSDLALRDRKVSGNAQRRGRRALLHQGTLLGAFDLPLMARYLREPSRQPAYRARRPHEAFVTNLSLPAGELHARLRALADLLCAPDGSR